MGGFFLYDSQLLAQEDNRSFFEKFFSSTPDDSIENEPPFGIDTDSITEKPVIEAEDFAKPGQADPEALNQNTVGIPSKEPIIEAQDFAKPKETDPEILNKQKMAHINNISSENITNHQQKFDHQLYLFQVFQKHHLIQN